ncbi:MAG: 50S ribosomal protein L30 [Acidobacteriota bacterium]
MAVKEKKLSIKLMRSLVGQPRKQREVVRGLGLRKLNSEVIKKDCPEVRGMITKVFHLVKAEELNQK